MKHNLMAVVPVGLEKVASKEIKDAINDAGNIQLTRGKVFFNTSLGFSDVAVLRCIDNLYFVISKFNVGSHKSDLEGLGDFIKKSHVKEAIDYAKLQKVKSIIVSASRSGKHTYSRHDVSEKTANILAEKYGYKITDSKSHDAAFRVDVNDDEVVFSMQLTSPDYKFRGDDYNPTVGGIRPSIAHCLVRLSSPKNDDIFYDPFCGAGTIVSERKHFKAKRILGSDIDQEVADKAKENVGGVTIFCADACNTKMADKSVNVIVSNIPWGVQVEVENIDELYIEFFKEAERILTDDGRLILLTDQDEALQSVAQKNNFSCEVWYQLSLHGLHPKVYSIKRIENIY